MQFASVGLWKALNYFGVEISLNDVCCYTPVWFGVVATMLLTSFVYLVSGQIASALFGGMIMAIIPAHIMRSVGGGYDNESVAVSCLCLTFMLWIYSLHSKDSGKASIVGLLTGLAYACMAASWGGYIFVLNLIGVHAAFLFVIGRFSNKLYWSYTLWYIIGTIGAMQVPVIGLTPIKSLEQLAPLCLFFFFQVMQFCELPSVQRFMGIDPEKVTNMQRQFLRIKVLGVAGGAFAGVAAFLAPTGYFGPLSSRVRGLFVKHTRTGNPLVDSVAEHQPASSAAFYQFLHKTCFTAPFGFLIAVFQSVIRPYFKPSSFSAQSDPMSFVVCYAAVTYFFATKMNRLMLLMGPVSSILSGIALGTGFEFCWAELMGLIKLVMYSDENPKLKKKSKKPKDSDKDSDGEDEKKDDESSGDEKDKAEVKKKKTSASKEKDSKKDKKDSKKDKKAANEDSAINGTWGDLLETKIIELYNLSLVRLVRKIVAVGIVYGVAMNVLDFYNYCQQMAEGLSHPSIMFQAKLQNGQTIMVDDYREAYWWLRDNTPEDSRVMAWWDYGYQITGIGNRTTIADGNTWNHEHIALLGRCLTSPEKKAHEIVKHLADYVLVWAGGGGDDLAKSPHMARIGNSVFEDICPDDPTCSRFGFIDRQMTPTPMMEASLLYRLHQNRLNPKVSVDSRLFKEVYMSKYGKVRIYQVVGVSKKSKQWAADPANRKCDAPGSWYCEGQYPPALNETIAMRKNFKQLEDFNVKQDERSKKYHEEYMKRMNGERGSSATSSRKSKKEKDTFSDSESDSPKSKKSKKSKTPPPPVVIEDEEDIYGGGGAEDVPIGVAYLGCYGAESSFSDREYYGGASGAYLNLALQRAQSGGKRYVAIARGADEGHSFGFSKLDGAGKKMRGGGCDRPCLDSDELVGGDGDSQDKYCGCIDDFCTGSPLKGEEHNRRWAVYEITTEF